MICPAYAADKDNGRILIPLRGILDEFGATVRWDETTGKIIVNRGNNRVELTPGFRTASINGQKYSLTVDGERLQKSTPKSGWERNLRDTRTPGLAAGVDGLITGGYLTTPGQGTTRDRATHPRPPAGGKILPEHAATPLLPK